MSKEERVMPFEKAQDVFPMKVTPDWGKGALGAWQSQGRSTGKPGGATIRTSLQGKPPTVGCMCASTQASRRLGRPAEEKPRSEPSRGNPAARDRREACGNVSMMGAGL